MFETYEINDGIKLHYYKDSRFKTITTSIFIRTRLTDNSATKTALVAECLRGGCKKYPSMRNMAVKLEEMWGSAYEVSVLKRGDEQIIYIYLEGLTKTFGEGIDFINDVLHQNCINNQRFLNKAKSRLKQSIDAIKDNKSQYAIERMTKELCKGTDSSFAVPVLGYAEEVDTLTRESVAAQWDILLESSLIEIFVVGNETEAVVKGQCAELFKGIRHSDTKPKNKTFKTTNREAITLVEEEGNNQGRLCMAFSCGAENAAEELIPFLVLNEILGGSSNSRLFADVREKEGLCYSINSFVFKQKMLLTVQAGIDKNAFSKVSEMVEKTVGKLESSITNDQLKMAKTSLIKAYEMSEDIPAEMINFALSMSVTGLEMDLNGFKKAVDSVTNATVKKMAEKLKCEIKYFLK